MLYRDRSASSKEKSRKRKSAELSSVSCAEIQTEVERQTPDAADEVETAKAAEKQQPMAEFQGTYVVQSGSTVSLLHRLNAKFSFELFLRKFYVIGNSCVTDNQKKQNSKLM